MHNKAFYIFNDTKYKFNFVFQEEPQEELIMIGGLNYNNFLFSNDKMSHFYICEPTACLMKMKHI